MACASSAASSVITAVTSAHVTTRCGDTAPTFSEDAVRILDQRRVNFEYEGDMAADVALNPEAAAAYRAQIDIARRLTVAIWHMLTREQPFAPKGATDPLAA